VRRIGIKTRKTIHSTNETGGNGISVVISSESSALPPGNWRKMASYSNSPVVIVIVLTIARPGVAKEDLCMHQNNRMLQLNIHTSVYTISIRTANSMLGSENAMKNAREKARISSIVSIIILQNV